jgi:hypothetical protein
VPLPGSAGHPAFDRGYFLSVGTRIHTRDEQRRGREQRAGSSRELGQRGFLLSQAA